MDALQFDAGSHIYSLGGIALPGVTRVIDAAGRRDGAAYWTPASRLRGQYVHKACELDDLGTLDESSLDPRLAPYVLAWRNFKRDCRVIVTEIERPVCSPLGYAGTPDRLATVSGALAVLDIKSGPPCRWHGEQLAAYAACFSPRRRRFGVYLTARTMFKLRPYDDPLDYDLWFSDLTDFKRKAESNA